MSENRKREELRARLQRDSQTGAVELPDSSCGPWQVGDDAELPVSSGKTWEVGETIYFTNGGCGVVTLPPENGRVRVKIAVPGKSQCEAMHGDTQASMQKIVNDLADKCGVPRPTVQLGGTATQVPNDPELEALITAAMLGCDCPGLPNHTGSTTLAGTAAEEIWPSDPVYIGDDGKMHRAVAAAAEKIEAAVPHRDPPSCGCPDLPYRHRDDCPNK